MKTLLLAVRHGETEWNLAGRHQGQLDSPLTSRGIRQAECLADGLADRHVDILFSSDLGRALHTAEIIAKRLSLEICTDLRIRERHHGIVQGLTRKEFADKYPDEAQRFFSGDPDYVLPGGESARQLYDRSVQCAEDVALRHPGKNVLIVGHGGGMSCYFRKATSIPLGQPRRFSLFNAAINSFRISGGQWHLDTWGEIAHLKRLDALDDD
jgi:2,3-bisphosphoglycerate-dependent phosphoglycerate mutase